MRAMRARVAAGSSVPTGMRCTDRPRSRAALCTSSVAPIIAISSPFEVTRASVAAIGPHATCHPVVRRTAHARDAGPAVHDGHARQSRFRGCGGIQYIEGRDTRKREVRTERERFRKCDRDAQSGESARTRSDRDSTQVAEPKLSRFEPRAHQAQPIFERSLLRERFRYDFAVSQECDRKRIERAFECQDRFMHPRES